MKALRLMLVLLPGLHVHPAAAHEGPPFPIVVDEETGPFRVSVWTDPDIGIGTFFVILEARESGPLPHVERVRVAVRPESGRLPQAFYDAEPQPVRFGARYYAEVPFDEGGWWDVRIVIESAAGGGDIASRVEATPDGTIGPIGLLVYVLPFVAVGFLWLRGFLVHRRTVRSEPLLG